MSIRHSLLLLSLAALMGCERTIDYAAMTLTLNPEALTAPTAHGFAPLDPKNSAFQSTGSWSEFATQVRAANPEKSPASLADWQVLSDLNLQAAGLWDELVACNQGDAEAARANYFRAHPCADAADAATTKAKLTQLHQRFFDFLATTQFKIPRSSTRNIPWNTETLGGRLFGRILADLGRSLSGQPGDFDSHDPAVRAFMALRNQPFPEFHPLFSQLVVEYLAVINRVTRSVYESPYRMASQMEHDNALLDFNFNPYPIGLRPSELAYWEELGKLNLLDRQETYVTARAFGNVWYLYSLMAKQDCDRHGLWPELSFASINVIRGHHFDTSREIARVIEDAGCRGKRPPQLAEWAQEPVRLNDRDLVLVQRQMGMRYGFKAFDRVKCLNDLRTVVRQSPDFYICFTVDPAAPHDLEDGKDWARGNFSNARALRGKQSYEFISKH